MMKFSTEIGTKEQSIADLKNQLAQKENELQRMKLSITSQSQGQDQALKALQDYTKTLADKNEQLQKELGELKGKQKQEQAALEEEIKRGAQMLERTTQKLMLKE